MRPCSLARITDKVDHPCCLSSYCKFLGVFIYCVAFMLASPSCLSVRVSVTILLIVLLYFLIVFLTWYDLTSYSMVLPITISALVFWLCSIRFKCIILYHYLNCTYMFLREWIRAIFSEMYSLFDDRILHLFFVTIGN